MNVGRGVVGALAAVGLLVGARALGAGAGTRAAGGQPSPTPSPSTDVTRVERDWSGQCIPADRDRQVSCSPVRLAFWNNSGNALAGLLRFFGIANPTEQDVLAAYIRIHVQAGDLKVIQQLTQALGWPAVRVTAVGLSATLGAEYAEVSNIGGARAELAGLELTHGSEPGLRPDWFVFGHEGLAPGQSCRVYSVPAGQADGCAGRWQQPVTRYFWPYRTCVAVLSYPSLGAGLADLWRYWTPGAGGP